MEVNNNVNMGLSRKRKCTFFSPRSIDHAERFIVVSMIRESIWRLMMRY